VPGLFLICFSGGPCAGKSKSIHHLIDKFEATETKILVAPEVATMISKSGGFIDMGEWSEKKIVEFQANLLLCQIDFEYQLFRIAERLLARQAYKQVIIICDRGLMDGKAYFKDELWFNMLKNFQVGEN
jgi:thymidylate kinase